MKNFNENLFYTNNNHTLGTLRYYKFENGFGASVLEYFDFVKEKTMFEIAVLEFENDVKFKITYRTGITGDVLRVERKKVADVLEKIKNLPDRKRIELKKENIGEVKVIYFKFIDGRFETVFEIRKFKNDKYRIASYGTGKDIDKHFVNFETVKDFFRTIKEFKKEF